MWAIAISMQTQAPKIKHQITCKQTGVDKMQTLAYSKISLLSLQAFREMVVCF